MIARELRVARRTDPHAEPVVGEDLEGLDVFSSTLPAICACMPQELLPIMPPSVLRLCVAGSGPKVRCRSSARAADRRARCQARPAPTARSQSISSRRFMYLLMSMHDRGIARRAGEVRRAAARDDGSPELAADRDRRHDVVGVARNHHADRDLPVVRGIGRVERAVPVVKRTSPRTIAAERGRQATRRRRLVSAPSPHRGVAAWAAGACPACGGAFVGRRYSVMRHGSFNASRGSYRESLRVGPLELEPHAGRARSGRSSPSTGVSTPSNSMCSIRTWSWKYSMWRSTLRRARGVRVQRRRTVRGQRYGLRLAQAIHDAEGR